MRYRRDYTFVSDVPAHTSVRQIGYFGWGVPHRLDKICDSYTLGQGFYFWVQVVEIQD
jgi:hypothetical protein